MHYTNILYGVFDLRSCSCLSINVLGLRLHKCQSNDSSIRTFHCILDSMLECEVGRSGVGEVGEYGGGCRAHGSLERRWKCPGRELDIARERALGQRSGGSRSNRLFVLRQVGLENTKVGLGARGFPSAVSGVRRRVWETRAVWMRGGIGGGDWIAGGSLKGTLRRLWGLG